VQVELRNLRQNLLTLLDDGEEEEKQLQQEQGGEAGLGTDQDTAAGKHAAGDKRGYL
jgi:hypothetical protein